LNYYQSLFKKVKTMDMVNINIEDLIPHRERMKLVDQIIEVDEAKAVTLSTVTDKWPLVQNDFVNPLVLIEIVAQTSAVSIGWKKLRKDGKNAGGKGWLVGIKVAEFFVDRIPLNTSIRTQTKINFSLDNYTEILGISKIGSDLVGEIVLQVLRKST
jgi:predicted hotdog family 3-hydroxylacyl-ACP dehydratase